MGLCWNCGDTWDYSPELVSMCDNCFKKQNGLILEAIEKERMEKERKA